MRILAALLAALLLTSPASAMQLASESTYAANNPAKHTDPNGTCVPGLGLDVCGMALETAYNAGALEKGGHLSNYVEMSHVVVGLPGLAMEATVPGMATFNNAVAGVMDAASTAAVDAAGIESPAARGVANAAVKGALAGIAALITHKVMGPKSSEAPEPAAAPPARERGDKMKKSASVDEAAQQRDEVAARQTKIRQGKASGIIDARPRASSA